MIKPSLQVCSAQPLGDNRPQRNSDPLVRLSPPPPHIISAALELKTLSIDWLAGDGSDRCYYRIRSPESAKSFVLMQLSGTDLENLKLGSYDWIEVGKILSEANVMVPKPVAIIKDYGSLIIDDYGDQMLESVALEAYRNGNILGCLPLYEACLNTLAKFIGMKPLGSQSWAKRSFDEARFIWEMDFFVTKYLEGVCDRALTKSERSSFAQETKALANYLSSESRYFVHRDFHSRNVMVTGDSIAVIDFQDARLGPVAYDLVSLCFDSYVPFTGNQRLALLRKGLEIFKQHHGKSVAEEAEVQWKPMLLQRQLKAIGSFGYLTVDKHKGNYLKNVAPALLTLSEVSLKDTRWPFISSDLLNILKETTSSDAFLSKIPSVLGEKAP